MFQHRLSHRVGRSSQATTAAVEKSGPSLTHRIQDTPRGTRPFADQRSITSGRRASADTDRRTRGTASRRGARSCTLPNVSCARVTSLAPPSISWPLLANETTVAVVIPLHRPRPGMGRNTQTPHSGLITRRPGNLDKRTCHMAAKAPTKCIQCDPRVVEPLTGI